MTTLALMKSRSSLSVRTASPGWISPAHSLDSGAAAANSLAIRTPMASRSRSRESERYAGSISGWCRGSRELSRILPLLPTSTSVTSTDMARRAGSTRPWFS